MRKGNNLTVKRVLFVSLACLAACLFTGLAACSGKKTYEAAFTSEASVGSVAPQQHKKGAKFDLPENGFTREFYEFTGWNDGENTYQPGDKYAMPGKNVIFTAQWRAVLKLQLSAAEAVYNGSVQKPDVSVSMLTGALNPAEYNVDWGQGNWTGAGSYTLTVAGKGQYSYLTGSADYTIKQKEIGVSVNTVNITYGDTADLTAPSHFVQGLIGSDQITLSFSAQYAAGQDVGDYDISAQITAGGENYAVGSVNGILRVAPRPLAITLENQTISRREGIDTSSGMYDMTGSLFGGDTVGISLTSNYRQGVDPAGTYAISVVLGGAKGNNYTAVLTGGILTVYGWNVEAVNARLSLGLVYNGLDLSEAVFTANPIITRTHGSGAAPVVTYSTEDAIIVQITGNKITAKNSGEAVISVIVDGYAEGGFTVNVTDYTDYIKIGTVSEFMQMDKGDKATAWNKNYVIVKDLDFNNQAAGLFPYDAVATPWLPSAYFTGILDGNGHTLSRIGFTATAMNQGNLIGNLGAGGVIRNLSIKDTEIKGGGMNAIIHGNYGGLIENIYAEVSIAQIATTNTTANNGCGSIFGQNRGGTVRNCIAYITAITNTYYTGLLGVRNVSPGLIENCFAVTTAAKPLICSTDPLSIDGVITGSKRVDNFTDLAGENLTSFDTGIWNITASGASLKAIVKAVPTAGAASGDPITFSMSDGIDLRDYIFMTRNTSLSFSIGGQNNITVDGNGVVTIIAGGDYTVTVTPADAAGFTFYLFAVDINFAQMNNVRLSMGLVYNSLDLSVGGYTITDPGLTGTGVTGSNVITYQNNNPSVVTLAGKAITAVSGGKAVIDIIVDGFTLGSFEVLVTDYTDYIKIGTETEFRAMARTGKYVLVKDINFAGATVSLFPWTVDSDTSNTTNFRGVLDGNGHTLSNAALSGEWNQGIIGHIAPSGEVRNLSVIGTTIKAIAAQGCIALFAHNHGLVENIYAEVTIGTSTAVVNNGIGALIGRNALGAVTRNCVVKIIAVTNVTNNYGLIATSNAISTIENCFAVTTAVSHQYLLASQQSGGTLAAGTITNSKRVDDFTALIGENLTSFDTGIWNITSSGASLKAVTKVLPKAGAASGDPIIILLADGALNLSDYIFKTKEITLGFSVGGQSDITVGASNGAVTVTAEGEYTVTVTPDGMTPFTVYLKVVDITAAQMPDVRLNMGLTYDFGQGAGIEDLSVSEYTIAADPVLGGSGVTGSNVITYASRNPSVATVAGKKITAAGNGTAVIDVIVDGFAISNFTVSVTDYTTYTKLGTVTEFMQIDKGEKATTWNRNYVLVSDLDFNNQVVDLFPYDAVATPWLPSAYFTGIIDGNGHTLRRIAFATAMNKGNMIGNLGTGGVIRNLSIKDTEIKGGGMNAIVHGNYGGLIENIYAEVTIGQGANTSDNNGVGVLFGQNTVQSGIGTGGIVRNCIVKIIAITNTNYTGLLGVRNASPASVENCFAVTSVVKPLTCSVTAPNASGAVNNSKRVDDFAALMGENLSSFDTNIWTITASGASLKVLSA